MGWASFTLAIQNSEQKQIKHIQKKHPILVRKFSLETLLMIAMIFFYNTGTRIIKKWLTEMRSSNFNLS